MTEADRSDVRLPPTPSSGAELNLRRSARLRGWRALARVNATAPGSAEEQLLFFCHAFNVSCTAPSPSPPGPPSPPAPLSAACKAAVKRDCPVAPAACADCVRQHASDLIDSDCPKPGPGAVAEVVAFCEKPTADPAVAVRPPAVTVTG